MAEGSLVLCSPLCFLLSKFNNTPVKMMKSALLDFYDDDTSVSYTHLTLPTIYSV